MIHHYLKTPDGQTHHEENCKQWSVVSCDLCGDVIPVTAPCMVITANLQGADAAVFLGRELQRHWHSQFHACVACVERINAAQKRTESGG